MTNKTKKIAVIHDHLSWTGGGERTALIMAEELGADFITAYANDGVYDDYRTRLGGRFIVLSKGIIDLRIIRFFHTRFIFWQARKRLAEYDILIASGQPATEAVAFYSAPTAKRIVYTHCPPRRIYDMYEYSRATYPWVLRPLFDIFVRMWRYLYESAVKRFDVNIANSQNIAARLRKYTGIEATAVVWPPILIDKFKWIKQGDYFLSWGRVDEAKRIEVIVKAFQKMPGLKLVIASAGPRLEAVKKLAAGYANIEILGYISDERLCELVGSCRAAIYIPIDEDAGMTHLEANAAGKPVLGVAEGGLLESIADGETGVLVKANPHEDDVVVAAQKMTAEWCLTRRGKCEDWARGFGKDIFVEKMRGFLR